jgi:hypothetical protein
LRKRCGKIEQEGERKSERGRGRGRLETEEWKDRIRGREAE